MGLKCCHLVPIFCWVDIKRASKQWLQVCFESSMYLYININSVRKQFENFTVLPGDYVDILIVAETNLDDSFSDAMFRIPGFQAPFRLDTSAISRDLLVFVKDHIISKRHCGISQRTAVQIARVELNLKLLSGC